AAERTGGYVTQVHPDEPIRWRAFELAATLNAPRLHNIRVTAPDQSVTFLPFSSSVVAGEEFCAIAMLGPAGTALPQKLSISANQDRSPRFFDVPVLNVTERANYLPRTWAKLEIDRLLVEDATENRDRIVELSKAMYVMTPFTSLLVLEDEEMYARFKVDRG